VDILKPVVPAFPQENSKLDAFLFVFEDIESLILKKVKKALKLKRKMLFR